MRVALVNGAFPLDRMGGSELQTMILGQWLVTQGCDVHYIAISADPSLPSSAEFEGMHVHRLSRDVAPAGRLQALASLLSTWCIDMCYCRMITWMPGVLRVCRAQRVPIVGHVASDMDLQETPWKARQLVGSFRRTRSGRLVPRSNEAFEQADHVIVQSETQLRRFRQKYDTPATLVRNMLPDMVPPSREPPRNRVLWVGSIKEVKRPELFVELARVSRGSALEFTMVGEIQDRRAGAAVLAADKALAGFTYVPSLPLLDAWQRIATSRMLVNTSRIEGFPNTFIQAWLSGIPVATLGVDPDGVIRRRRIGIVCSDVTDLRRSLLGGILDGPRWHGQAGRARRHASTTHSIDVNGPLFSRVLEEARAEYHAS